MSGWQRIGIVISVLWLLGLPAYLLIYTNQNADKYYSSCRTITRAIVAEYRKAGKHDLADAEEQQAHDDCWQKASYMGPGVLAHIFVAGNFETVVAWGMLLVPIVLLWLVGGIVFGTVRWVRRGFTGSGR